MRFSELIKVVIFIKGIIWMQLVLFFEIEDKLCNEAMFGNSSFNQDIGNCDVDSVNDNGYLIVDAVYF